MTREVANLISIAVQPPGALIPQGDVQQFTAIGTYSNGNTQDLTATVVWSSDDPSVTIDATGMATGVGPGAATITAASGPVAGAAYASVEAGLQSITVAPAQNVSIPLTQTQQFAAVGIFSDSHTEGLTDQVIWSSDSPAIVTINSAGLATAVAEGSTFIRATAGSVSGFAPVIAYASAVANPCQLLQQALGQLYLLNAGQAVVAIETPQLGRVEYSKGSAADLQRMIDTLAAACVACGGQLPPGYYGGRRKPISIEAWP